MVVPIRRQAVMGREQVVRGRGQSDPPSPPTPPEPDPPLMPSGIGP